MFTVDDDLPATRPARNRSAVPAILGAIVGVALTAAGIAWWEWRGKPPADAGPAPADQSPTGFTASDLAEVASILAGVGVVLATVALVTIVPALLPVALSRRGYLSTGRWAALAGFAVLVLFGGLTLVITADSAGPLREEFHRAGSLMSTVALFGAGGCLLAAAFHPKSPAGSAT